MDMFLPLAYPSRELRDLSEKIEPNQWDGESAGDYWDPHGQKKRRISRDKGLLIGLKVVGATRVSDASSQWEVVICRRFLF